MAGIPQGSVLGPLIFNHEQPRPYYQTQQFVRIPMQMHGDILLYTYAYCILLYRERVRLLSQLRMATSISNGSAVLPFWLGREC